jgi:hypothetical protein
MHVVFLQDLLVYGQDYRHEVAEHVVEETLLHTDLENPPTYVSRAYFEK